MQALIPEFLVYFAYSLFKIFANIYISGIMSGVKTEANNRIGDSFFKADSGNRQDKARFL